MANPFLDLKHGDQTGLAAGSRFTPAGHLWSQREIDALILAAAARRPLLVRGEAGSGKSQIARAAAQLLNAGEPLVEVIHPRFEALDLLYRFDAVARLADAQAGKLERRQREKYVQKGALWQAFEQARAGQAPVLLIDEIDKADADIPNALLDVLGNRSFSVPHLGGRIVQAADGQPPLIVITTNEERELPPAFVRRCVVLNLNPPDGGTGFTDWLVERSRVHQHLRIAETSGDGSSDVRRRAADQVWADRQVAARNGFAKPGLAEYIDLLTALHELTGTIEDPEALASEQIQWLDRLSAYALVKNPEQDQGRKPAAPRDSGETGA
jgi:MoxR-like ATPase